MGRAGGRECAAVVTGRSSLPSVVGAMVAVTVIYRVARFLWSNCDGKQRRLRLTAPKASNSATAAWAQSPMYFVNARGLLIYHREVRPAAPRAVAVLVHGIGEHCGRYESVVARLAAKGVAVRTLDLEGHGRSEGLPAYAESLGDWVDDVVRVASAETTLPVFLLGHSLGGLLSLHAALRHLEEPAARIPRLAGVVVIAPPVVPIPPNAALAAVATALSAVLPKLQLSKLDAADLCTDPRVCEAYMNDPLCYHGGFRARVAAEIIKSMKLARDKLATSFPLPLLLAHGTKDAIVHPDGSTVWYRTLASDCVDKTLSLIDAAFHEVLFEPDKGDHVLDEIATWMLQRS